jgi:hypothetical protein
MAAAMGWRIGLAAGAALAGAWGARAQTTTASAPFQLRLVCEGVQTEAAGERASAQELQAHREAGPPALLGPGVEVKRRLEVAIAGASGRIRLPRGMFPNLSAKSPDGWLPVSDLSVGEDEITGRIALNLMNHPTLVIDRVSGEMTLSGMTRFRGACEKAPDRPIERKF